jgi:hypothetical protein
MDIYHRCERFKKNLKLKISCQTLFTAGSHRLTAKLMLKELVIFAISNLNASPNLKPKNIRKYFEYEESAV